MRLSLILLLLPLTACAETRTPAATGAAEHVGIAVDEVPVRVRIARTHAERAHGLKGVTQLAPDEGMLFLYRESARRSIWMQDCRIALDVAFADEAGRILQVVTLQPPTRTGGRIEEVRSDAPGAYVLEVPAGFFARHGLGPGSQLRLPPSIDRASAAR